MLMKVGDGWLSKWDQAGPKSGHPVPQNNKH